jgi:hypothetical protein
MADLIKDTAKKVGVSEKALFRRVYQDKGMSNALECADYRYQRWFKYGEIPAPVEDWCLTHWRVRDFVQALAAG